MCVVCRHLGRAAQMPLLLLSSLIMPLACAQFAPSPASVIVATIPRPDRAQDDVWAPISLVEFGFNANSAWPNVSTLALDGARCASGAPCLLRNRCPTDTYGAPRLSPDGATLSLGGEFVRAAAAFPEALLAQRAIAEVSARGAVTVTNFSGACGAAGQTGSTCGAAASGPTATVLSAQGVGAAGWAVSCRRAGAGNRFVFRNTTVARIDSGNTNNALLATSAINSGAYTSLVLAASNLTRGTGVYNLGNVSTVALREPPYATYLNPTDPWATCNGGGFAGPPADVFVETPQKVWACAPFQGTLTCPVYGVQLYTQAYPGAPWGKSVDPFGRFLLETPCSSLTGRLEGASVVLYATTCWGSPRSSCTPTLRRIVTSTPPSETTIATAPAGTAFHGVSLPPCTASGASGGGAACPTLTAGVWRLPSPTPYRFSSSPTPGLPASPTGTPTPPASPTGTRTSSRSPDATGTPTPSTGAPVSLTSTATPSATATATATVTPTATPTMPPTGAGSDTPTGSPTPSPSASDSPTPGGTASASPSATGALGSSPSSSASPSPTTTPSATGTESPGSAPASLLPSASGAAGSGSSSASPKPGGQGGDAAAAALNPGAVGGIAAGGSLGFLALLCLVWLVAAPAARARAPKAALFTPRAGAPLPHAMVVTSPLFSAPAVELASAESGHDAAPRAPDALSAALEAAPAPAAVAAALPAGWVMMSDETDVWYVNEATGETQWEPPSSS